MLIQNGADVNAVDEFEQTALHIAALEGHVDIVEVLLQNGADVNAVDISAKRTAFDYSVHLLMSVAYSNYCALALRSTRRLSMMIDLN